MTLAKQFDHADSRISGELFDWGTRLRNESQLSFSEAHGGFWIASRHKDILAICRDTQSFICSQRITLPPQNSPVPVIPLESDAPDHVFYRSVLTPFLTPKAVREHEPRIRGIVVGALQALIARGAGDAVRDFAALVPARSMAMIFGFTDEDAYRFEHGFSALVAATGSGDVARQMAAVEEFKAFLMEKLEAGRADPTGTDLVSAILKHEVAGRRYTEDECLGLMWSAAGGAIDTTKHAIGHAVREIGSNAAIRRTLIETPSLIAAAVEESLRMNAPAFMDARYVAKDVTLGGADLKAGERVLLVYGWANQDEAAFPEPKEMRLDRPLNRHLTFGHGIHQCAGLHLARLELKIAIEELLARIPDYELAEATAHPVLHGGMMWGYDSLPLRVPGPTRTAT